ncbi:RNA polymerase sigma factor [Alteribacter aurantiacus]|uniref:RNA polymerase sigma factor n=1 Tax=Alteribacter aurantiacus TaxID=254410 RepID=UPI0004198917|nr:sigma factor [Alteribacter aurantiacus]
MTDQDLINNILSGDEEAIEILHERYVDRIYTYIKAQTNNHHDAEELLQDVFFKVAKQLDRFEGRASFKTWLLTITRKAEPCTLLTKGYTHCLSTLFKVVRKGVDVLNIRPYETKDETGWLRCRVLSFLDNACFGNVLTNKRPGQFRPGRAFILTRGV